jgi:hypothetical protein
MGREGEARANLREAASLGREFHSFRMEVLALAHLALLPGCNSGEALERFELCEARLSHLARMEARFLLWQSTGDRSHLAHAHALLMAFRDHAPERDRETLIPAVPLYRDIEEAWRGLPGIL